MKWRFVIYVALAAPSCLFAGIEGMSVKWLSGDINSGRIRIKTWPARGSEIEADVNDGYLEGEFEFHSPATIIQGSAHQGSITNANVQSTKWRGSIHNGYLVDAVAPKHMNPDLDKYKEITDRDDPFGQRIKQNSPALCDVMSDKEGLNRRFKTDFPLVSEDYTCKEGRVHGSWRQFEVEGFTLQELHFVNGWLHGRQRLYLDQFESRETFFEMGEQISPVYDNLTRSTQWSFSQIYFLRKLNLTSHDRKPLINKITGGFKLVGAIYRDAQPLKSVMLIVGYDSLKQVVLGAELMGIGAGGHLGCIECSNAGIRASFLKGTGDNFGAELNSYVGLMGIGTIRFSGGARYQSEFGFAAQPSIEVGILSGVGQFKFPYYLKSRQWHGEAAFIIGIPLMKK